MNPTEEKAKQSKYKQNLYFIKEAFSKESAEIAEQISEDTLMLYPEIIKEFSALNSDPRSESTYDRVQRWHTLSQQSEVGAGSCLQVSLPQDFPKTREECKDVAINIQLTVVLPEIGRPQEDSKNLRLQTIEKRIKPYAIFQEILLNRSYHAPFKVLCQRGLSYDEQGTQVYNLLKATFGCRAPSKAYTVEVEFKLNKLYTAICTSGLPGKEDMYPFSVPDPKNACHHTFTNQQIPMIAPHIFFNLPQPPTDLCLPSLKSMFGKG